VIGRVVAVLAVSAVGTLVSIAPTPAMAEAGYNGPCTDNVGVTVVVDFRELGGGVNVRCAPGPVATGLDAFDRAGIAWESTRRFAGFVCRIAGRPGADAEPCGTTPPATAYWGYWVAPRGGEWCYSTLGPGSRKPPPGSIEGWSFALNKVGVKTPQPGFAPPAAIAGEAPNPLSTADCGTSADPAPAPTTAATRAPAPTTTPPASSTAVTTPTTATPPTTAAGTPPGAPASAAASTPAAPGGPPSTATTESAAPVPTTTATTTTATSPATTATAATTSAAATTTSVVLGTVDLTKDRRSGGRPGATTAIGATAAVGLAGAGVWAARRRRVTL
jgi:hypothetical protein